MLTTLVTQPINPLTLIGQYFALAVLGLAVVAALAARYL